MPGAIVAAPLTAMRPTGLMKEAGMAAMWSCSRAATRAVTKTTNLEASEPTTMTTLMVGSAAERGE
jgi:hypothetical protein